MNEPTAKCCAKCGEVKSLDDFYRNARRADGHSAWCKNCQREANRRWQAANPEARRQAQRRYREKDPEAYRESKRRYRAANPEAARETNRRHREANREAEQERKRRQHAANPETGREANRRWHTAKRTAVFDHYGWQCACCGSAEKLTIDHMNGGGADHRKQIGVGGTTLYRWLVTNGFPEGFQTLCRPCNKSKDRGERCRIDHEAANVA